MGTSDSGKRIKAFCKAKSHIIVLVSIFLVIGITITLTAIQIARHYSQKLYQYVDTKATKTLETVAAIEDVSLEGSPTALLSCDLNDVIR